MKRSSKYNSDQILLPWGESQRLMTLLRWLGEGFNPGVSYEAWLAWYTPLSRNGGAL